MNKLSTIGFWTCCLIAIFQCGEGYHESALIAKYGPEPITKFLKVSPQARPSCE